MMLRVSATILLMFESSCHLENESVEEKFYNVIFSSRFWHIRTVQQHGRHRTAWQPVQEAGKDQEGNLVSSMEQHIFQIVID